MTYVQTEIASQPDCWRRAAELAGAPGLPRAGERVAVVGCGTSWFIGQAYAALRERGGHGETDAFQASEFPLGRRYDRIVAISRSGSTTEVVDLLDAVSTPTVVITADPAQPAAARATDAVVLDFADEQAVVQTRFATSTLALLRTHLGYAEDVTRAAADAEFAVRAPLPLNPVAVEQVTFVGRGWTNGLAQEAALKCREAATFWTEAYPAMDFRHGPISIAAPGRAVWAFGEIPAGLVGDVEATGAAFVHTRFNGVDHEPLDPMADLILAQRFAVALARLRGLDPDHPRNLTRSVILEP
jgi:fructoselysine-6-P-deglycase FrlB-like protein